MYRLYRDFDESLRETDARTHALLSGRGARCLGGASIMGRATKVR